jgi:uncharacterized protein
VVNSPVSQVVLRRALGYAGSRWALRCFTAALRSDLRRTGVGVTEVTPGKVSSDYSTTTRVPRSGFPRSFGSSRRSPRRTSPQRSALASNASGAR